MQGRGYSEETLYLCYHLSLPLSHEFQVLSAGGLVRADFAGVS